MSPNPHKTANLVTFTEEILNGKLYFLIRGLRHCFTYLMRTIPDISHLSNPLDDAIDIFIKDILAIQLIMSYFHYHQNTVDLD